jgi:LPXTG-site transpeptidase (sortase) family protein
MKKENTTPVIPSKKHVHPKATMSFRRHFLPPILGGLIFVGVLGLLNEQWMVAQYQYHTLKPVAAAAIDPSFKPDKDSVQLQIPSIGVTAPVVYDEPSYAEWKVQIALRRGVVHYGTAALPGQAGNIVILGHSSEVAWAPGDYKFVFTMLNKTAIGDRIFLDYKGTRYIYRIKETKVIAPSDLSLIQPTKKPQLTLITCTPVGTDKNRLVVIAEQVSPDPSTATPIAAQDTKPVTSWAIPR